MRMYTVEHERKRTAHRRRRYIAGRLVRKAFNFVLDGDGRSFRIGRKVPLLKQAPEDVLRRSSFARTVEIPRRTVSALTLGRFSTCFTIVVVSVILRVFGVEITILQPCAERGNLRFDVPAVDDRLRRPGRSPRPRTAHPQKRAQNVRAAFGNRMRLGRYHRQRYGGLRSRMLRLLPIPLNASGPSCKMPNLVGDIDAYAILCRQAIRTDGLLIVIVRRVHGVKRALLRLPRIAYRPAGRGNLWHGNPERITALDGKRKVSARVPDLAVVPNHPAEPVESALGLVQTNRQIHHRIENPHVDKLTVDVHVDSVDVRKALDVVHVIHLVFRKPFTR